MKFNNKLPFFAKEKNAVNERKSFPSVLQKLDETPGGTMILF